MKSMTLLLSLKMRGHEPPENADRLWKLRLTLATARKEMGTSVL